MNVVFGYAFRIDSNVFANPVLQVPSFGEVIDFLEVNQDRHAQFRGQRIHAAQLRAIGGDMKLHLAESLRAVLDRLREHLFGVRLGHVVAVEPGEAARRRRLQRLHLFERRAAREQVRLRHAGAVEMREVARPAADEDGSAGRRQASPTLAPSPPGARTPASPQRL